MIQVRQPTPVRFNLVYDPDTWIEVRPPTFADRVYRDKFIGDRKMEIGDTTILHVPSNYAELMCLEAWLTYVDSNLVVQELDGDGNVVAEHAAAPRARMTQDQFFKIWALLPWEVQAEWHDQVIAVSPGWALPF